MRFVVAKCAGKSASLGFRRPREIDVQRTVYKELRTTSARVYRIRDYLAAINLIERCVVNLMSLISQDALLGFDQTKAGETALKILLAP